MTAAPVRDLTQLPTDPARVRSVANRLRAELGKNAAAQVRRWISEAAPGDTHIGIGAPTADVLREIEALDAIAVRPTPVEKTVLWTEHQMTGAL
jgi:hypothetical protein